MLQWIWSAIDKSKAAGDAARRAAIGALAVGCLHLLYGAWRSFEFWSKAGLSDPGQSLMLLISQPAMYIGWFYLLAVPGIYHLSRFSCGFAVFLVLPLQYVLSVLMGLWSFSPLLYMIPLLLAVGALRAAMQLREHVVAEKAKSTMEMLWTR